jgi:NitT/TauT family transport system substrate-binding protein
MWLKPGRGASVSDRLRRASIVPTGLVVACVLVACGGSTPSSTASHSAKCSSVDTVNYANIPGIVQFAPPQIPISEGTMAKNCINFVPVTVESSAVALAEVVSGRLDFAFENPSSVVSAVASGTKLKIVTPGISNTATSAPFYVLRNGPIKTPKDLEGKKVETTELLSSSDIAARISLARAGVDISKVQFVFIPSATGAQEILAGQVAGGQVNQPYAAEAGNKLRVLIQSPSAEAYGLGSPAAYMVSSAAWVDSHRALVTRFQKAWLEAALLVQKHPQILLKAEQKIAGFSTALMNKIGPQFGMPTSFGVNSLITQVADALKYKAIPKGLPASQIRALFVPLPSLKSLS